MRFGKTLRESFYSPWKDKYIDYAKLKSLLREDKYDDDDVPWTEEDENRFCDEIFNTQLEKVAEFQEATVNSLRERTDAAFEKLKDTVPAEGNHQQQQQQQLQQPKHDDATIQRFTDLKTELDRITNEIKELKKYSNINYTAFLKIVKKHDRKRGGRYKVRPMMQLSLSRRPFNSEQGYSPLLNKLSIMYYVVRQQLDDSSAPGEQHPPDLENQEETHNGERYTAHKFWVHPDNLLEVKTYILRQLPALVYSSQSSKELDAAEDPTITSLYFDDPKFDLYSAKVDRQGEASSFRVRWFGQLSAKPDVMLEQKTVGEKGVGDERKLTVKEKHVKSFLDGDYKTDKAVQKMKRQSHTPQEIDKYKETVASLQSFVKKRQLQPVVRANYVRSAFQKPSDDRVRVSLDTELSFVREDTLDKDRPCRDPDDWHRRDIDDRNMAYPFKDVNKSEVSRFPYAVLEIKIKDDAAVIGGNGASNRKRTPAWVEDLMGSHLVHPAPRFSKFVHGVASLFEDYVNNLPFWLSDLEGDIRKDPQKAFEAEEKRRSQRAEDESAVGSFLGKRVNSFRVSRSSPVSQSYLAERMAAESSGHRASASTHPGAIYEGEENEDEEGEGEEEGEATGLLRRQHQQQQLHQQSNNGGGGYGTLSSIIPAFSLSRYSRARRDQQTQQQQMQTAARRSLTLPEGVVEPAEWIKNAGELKIEPKVWLANERTFLKWQHICVLLGSLALGLYSAAGEDSLAAGMGLLYILIAAFAGGWGYVMMRTRSRMIVERSGKDFDNVVGPLVVSVALMVALVLNFVFAYRRAFQRWDEVGESDVNATLMAGGLGEELR